MVVAIGLDTVTLATLATAFTESAAAAGSLPIFLVDDEDGFAVLRRHQARFEHLPAASVASLDKSCWHLYAARRFVLLVRKWEPARIVACGPVATAWLLSVMPATGADAALIHPLVDLDLLREASAADHDPVSSHRVHGAERR